MTTDRELYYGDFEREGEEAVRNNPALGRYQSQKAALAREWIAREDQSRKDATQAEQARAASLAVTAAERAATAAERQVTIAEKANRIAIAAVIIAIAAAILSLIAMVRG